MLTLSSPGNTMFSFLEANSNPPNASLLGGVMRPSLVSTQRCDWCQRTRRHRFAGARLASHSGSDRWVHHHSSRSQLKFIPGLKVGYTIFEPILAVFETGGLKDTACVRAVRACRARVR